MLILVYTLELPTATLSKGANPQKSHLKLPQALQTTTSAQKCYSFKKNWRGSLPIVNWAWCSLKFCENFQHFRTHMPISIWTQYLFGGHNGPQTSGNSIGMPSGESMSPWSARTYPSLLDGRSCDRLKTKCFSSHL